LLRLIVLALPLTKEKQDLQEWPKRALPPTEQPPSDGFRNPCGLQRNIQKSSPSGQKCRMIGA